MPGFSGKRRKVAKGAGGSVSIETTFFIIISVLLFFGAVELGRALSLKHSMDVGCYRAARYLSLNPGDVATAVQMIRDEVDGNVLGGNYGDQVVVVIDMPSTTFQTPFTVSASLDYQPLVPFMDLSLVTLRVQHGNVVEAYP